MIEKIIENDYLFWLLIATLLLTALWLAKPKKKNNNNKWQSYDASL